MTTVQITQIPEFIAQAADLVRGLSIAISGLLIVFLALMMITAFIASLPRILRMVAIAWPESEPVHVAPSHAETADTDDGALLAAIGFVLHTEIQKQLAMEQSTEKK